MEYVNFCTIGREVFSYVSPIHNVMGRKLLQIKKWSTQCGKKKLSNIEFMTLYWISDDCVKYLSSYSFHIIKTYTLQTNMYVSVFVCKICMVFICDMCIYVRCLYIIFVSYIRYTFYMCVAYDMNVSTYTHTQIQTFIYVYRDIYTNHVRSISFFLTMEYS